MENTRRARLESVLLDELSRMIRDEIKDPRVPAVTLTQVELTQDAAQATVSLLILGDRRGEPEQDSESETESPGRSAIQQCLEGLNSASGFLRHQLKKILHIRYIPHLIFKEDRGLDNTFRVHELLKQIKKSDKEKDKKDDGSQSA